MKLNRNQYVLCSNGRMGRVDIVNYGGRLGLYRLQDVVTKKYIVEKIQENSKIFTKKNSVENCFVNVTGSKTTVWLNGYIGRARKHPSDKNNPAYGFNLAFSRANEKANPKPQETIKKMVEEKIRGQSKETLVEEVLRLREENKVLKKKTLVIDKFDFIKEQEENIDDLSNSLGSETTVEDREIIVKDFDKMVKTYYEKFLK